LSLHLRDILVSDEYCDKDVVVQNATLSIKSQMPIISCTVQVESFNVEGVNNCKQCRLREC